MNEACMYSKIAVLTLERWHGIKLNFILIKCKIIAFHFLPVMVYVADDDC